MIPEASANMGPDEMDRRKKSPGDDMAPFDPNAEKDRTILLVDDEADIREVLSIALTDFGYAVRAVKNGREALDAFAETHPPIVLTDIKMPGMDGIDLLKAVKRDNPDVEVIMITGHGDMNLAIKSLKHEAADFITKPINVDALKIALKRVEEKILIKRKLKEYTESLESLVREKIELQDRLSSLGMMIASISHGVKGLLTNLDAGIYLMDAGLKKEKYDQSKDGLDILKTTAEHIKKLVLDILFYAKEREAKTEPVDMPAFAEDVAGVIESKTTRAGIRFVRDFAAAPAIFVMDADMMRTALVNIFDNAVDACTVDTGKPEHEIRFRVAADGDELVMEIHDTGVGMDGETRDKIFDLFFSSKGSKGTGFGLFITRNIVRQHGGEINVHSIRGKGTKFVIRIPKKTEKRERASDS